MSAVVGILNKQAVAIAADSAVTISGANGRKILNKANKVFTLSKYHPVGVMIYSSASFMATPWETIIKIYRKQLGEDSFATVKEYQENFINFLRAKQFFTTPELQIGFLENLTGMIINSIIDDLVSINRKLIDNPTDENKTEFINLLEKKIDELIGKWENQECCDEFTEYSFEDFLAYSAGVFNRLINTRFTPNGFNLSDELIIKIKRMVYNILRAKEELTSYTGLIFTGFGEDEIYPRLIPVNISMVINDRLRYYVNESRTAIISNEIQGAIRPFAQQDVIDTILTGVDPLLGNTYLNNFGALFDKYNQEILAIIGNTNPEVTAQIQSLNTQVIVNEYAKMNQQIKTENYINPLMNAVSSLAKEDLAEMAESLIYLTYLKRRITFAEESVGGAVDVAIISKGDGFLWIKRKHYFRPELNQHFFDNYFNK